MFGDIPLPSERPTTFRFKGVPVRTKLGGSRIGDEGPTGTDPAPEGWEIGKNRRTSRGAECRRTGESSGQILYLEDMPPKDREASGNSRDRQTPPQAQAAPSAFLCLIGANPLTAHQ